MSTMVAPIRARLSERAFVVQVGLFPHHCPLPYPQTVSTTVYLLLLELQQPSKVRQHQQPNHFLL